MSLPQSPRSRKRAARGSVPFNGQVALCAVDYNYYNIKNMRKQTKQVTLVDLDFDNLKPLNDSALYEHFQRVCALSKKRLVPKNLDSNAFRVTRNPKCISIHFLFVARKGDPGAEVFRFSFAPAPRFA